MFVVDKDIIKHRVVSYTAKMQDSQIWFHVKTLCGTYVNSIELQPHPRCPPKDENSYCGNCLKAFMK